MAKTDRNFTATEIFPGPQVRFIAPAFGPLPRGWRGLTPAQALPSDEAGGPHLSRPLECPPTLLPARSYE